jgi:transcriptional regulator with XRE-family HTH domain
MHYDKPNRYSDRMDMPKILARVGARIAELGTTPATVSRRATGSPDTIRNWSRRVKRGDLEVGASIATLQLIAEELKVPLNWLLGEGEDDLTEFRGVKDDRQELLSLYDRADPSDREKIVAIARTVTGKPAE